MFYTLLQTLSTANPLCNPPEISSITNAFPRHVSETSAQFSKELKKRKKKKKRTAPVTESKRFDNSYRRRKI